MNEIQLLLLFIFLMLGYIARLLQKILEKLKQ